MASLAAIGWAFFNRDQAWSSADRAALTTLFQAINPGDSSTAVSQAIERYRSPNLRLVPAGMYWGIHAPTAVGEKTWVLWVEFRSGKARSVMIRTEDGPAAEGAPADKVADL